MVASFLDSHNRMRTAYIIIGGLLILAVALITVVPALAGSLVTMPRVTENGIEWPVKKSVRFYMPAEDMGSDAIQNKDRPDAKTRCGTASVCSDPTA